MALAATLALAAAAIVWVARVAARGAAAVPARSLCCPPQARHSRPLPPRSTGRRWSSPPSVEAIRTWNLTTGRSAAPVIDVDAQAVSAVEVNGAPAVVSRGPDQLMHVHRLADGRELGGAIGDAEPVPPVGSFEAGRVREVLTTEVAGRPVVVAVQATETDRIPNLGFGVWSLPAGELIVDRVSPGQTVTLDLATATVDGTAVVVALGADGPIQMYEAATGRPIGSRIELGVPDQRDRGRRPGGGPCRRGGVRHNSVRLFDLRTGAPVGPVLRGHVGPVVQIAVVGSGGRDLVVSTASGRPPSGATETRFLGARRRDSGRTRSRREPACPAGDGRGGRARRAGHVRGRRRGGVGRRGAGRGGNTMIGTRFGPYRVESRLGGGGMGEV